MTDLPPSTHVVLQYRVPHGPWVLGKTIERWVYDDRVHRLGQVASVRRLAREWEDLGDDTHVEVRALADTDPELDAPVPPTQGQGVRAAIAAQLLAAIDAELDKKPCPLCGLVHRHADGCPPHEVEEIRGIFSRDDPASKNSSAWASLSPDAQTLAVAIHQMRVALGFDVDGDPTPAAEIAGMGVGGYAAQAVRDAQQIRADLDAEPAPERAFR